MLAQVEKILHDNSLCVLCTAGEGVPHCSLMTYLLSDDQRTLYMVSTAESKKYRNLLSNPHVSVLIDTRQDYSGSGKGMVSSVTFEGTYQPLEENDTQRIRLVLAEEHPELSGILSNPEGVLFGIKLDAFLLLNGPVDSYQGVLTDK